MMGRHYLREKMRPRDQQKEFLFPQLIVVPLSTHEVDGVRKEKEGLTAKEPPWQEMQKVAASNPF